MKKLYRKRKYSISLITLFSLFIQLFVPFFSIDANAVGSNEQIRNENGVILVDINNTYEETEFYKDSLFGIAGGFHLVGLDTVDKKAHVHGNILTNNFINGGDFGTRNLKEVSYLRNISGGGTISAGADKESVLVVGKDTNIGTADNGNAWSINGNKVDRPNKQNSPDSLWQDDSVEFIDFDEVKQQVKGVTDDLAELENNATEIKNDDWNKQEIIVTEDSDYNVYNLQDGDFIFPNPIHIKGFNKDKASTLIINVDMGKMKNKELFSIPNSVASYTDGSKVSTAEVSEWSNANVVWNIFDSSKSDNIYTGTVENTGAVTGSILAIGATINLKHNLNGTVIGNKIVVTGETHRDDYVPPSKPELETTEISVEKKWIGEKQDSVTVNLLADGEKVDTIELNEGNDWKHTFTDLPVVHDITDEEAINYTVEEVTVDGYKTSITGSAALGFVITNTEDTPLTPIEPGTTSVDVSKKWIGEKQDSVTVNLLADGEKVDTIELNEGNDWKHTFTDLPVVHDITDEEAINYTVEEVTVDGYKTSITGSAALGFVITNTEDTPLTPIEPGTTSVDVSKKWIGEKQDSVTVNLLADGEKVDTIELNEGNDWKHTFTDLPVVHDITDEEAINYTVEEVEIEGYESSIAGSAALGFVITNTEDTKPEDTKPEDPKPEDPKPEDPKPEDPKPEDPKPEDPKPEDPKPEDPKPEDPKPEDPKPEDPKPEDPKPEDPKPEDPKPEDPKPEDPKPEDPKPEDPKPEDPKPEDPKNENLPKTGETTNFLAPIGISLILIGLWTLFTKRSIKE